MLGLSFTSKLDKGSYIIYINKTASKKFLIWPCKEHSCHVWAGAPNCSLHMLDKLQKWACRTVGPSLAASLEPLTHHGNAVSFRLFYRYFFNRCSSELAGLVPLPHFCGRSAHDF